MRIRSIKPEFFTHDGIFEAERETGLPLRLAFIGLWCAADRDGRFKWEPRRMGVSILPYDSVDFSRVLDALVTRGFVVKYRVGNAIFGCIPSFSRHQVINNRESASAIPDVSSGEVLGGQARTSADACPTRAPREKAEGKGREEEGKGTIADFRPENSAAGGPDEFDLKDQTAPAAPRARNELFDALAVAEGSNPHQLTQPAAKTIGKALADIRRACPGLTPAEIAKRATNYRLHMPDATLTASALAKWWAKVGTPPGGKRNPELINVP